MNSLKWSVAFVLALAVASPALADQPKPPAAKASASAEKGKGDKEKGDKEKAEKGKEKPEPKEPPKADKETTKKKSKEERDELKPKVEKALKGKGMHPSMKEELKRHARRVARLERIEALAKANADDDATDRVHKLIDKENARHDKWMANFDPTKAEKGGAK